MGVRLNLDSSRSLRRRFDKDFLEGQNTDAYMDNDLGHD